VIRPALRYAELGWAVFPLHSCTTDGLDVVCTCGRADCTSVGKHPRVRQGVKEATTNADQVEAWWRQWPDANIGLATGPPSGIYVVDLDGPEAIAAWRELGADDGAWISRTGNGEHHVYAATDALPSTHWKIARGIDTRGAGGYIVAPPSLHRTGRRYAWVEPVVKPMGPLPELVRAAVTPSMATAAGPPELRFGSTSKYGQGVLKNAVERIRIAGEGTRNSTLNDESFLVGQFIAGGEIDPTGVQALLEQASTDTDRKKVRTTAARGLRDGANFPRRAPA
jgi:hypothetical protein